MLKAFLFYICNLWEDPLFLSLLFFADYTSTVFVGFSLLFLLFLPVFFRLYPQKKNPYSVIMFTKMVYINNFVTATDKGESKMIWHS